jgi:molybdopterin adenylyltransferase
VRVSVITVSDRASRGEYEDLSGPEIERAVRGAFPDAHISGMVVPDEQDRILEALEKSGPADFIITTGGTGISPRDVTPEATRRFCQRELPGLAETLRAESYRETPAAMLSRGFAGMRGASIVVNLPGSVKAVRLGMKVLLPVMEHALRMVRGEGH